MKLTLREKLGLASSATDEDVRVACTKHILIYENLVANASDEQIKSLAATKLDDLKKCAGQEGIPVKASSAFAKNQVISYTTASVEEILAGAGANGLTQAQAKNAYNELAKLPNSPKKIYLNAVVRFLTEPRNLTSLNVFSQAIGTARNMDPDNIAYSKIIDSCTNEVNQYNTELNLWRDNRIAQIKADAKKEKTKSVLAVIGDVLLAIGGGILAVIGGIFGCLCEAADC